MANQHPTDSLPAFALDALDQPEAISVIHHLKQCPACRAEVEALRDTLATLPYAVSETEPPSHIRQQLVARITASQPYLPHAARSLTLWHWATVTSVFLLLACGFVILDTRSRMTDISQQIALKDQLLVTEQATSTAVAQKLQTLENQLAQAPTTTTIQPASDSTDTQEEAIRFLAAPETIAQSFANTVEGVTAKLYMQPGKTKMMLAIEGLPLLDTGHSYQVWLENSTGAIRGTQFVMGGDKTTAIMVDTTFPIEQFTRIIVTVERDDGGIRPSDEVVLETQV